VFFNFSDKICREYNLYFLSTKYVLSDVVIFGIISERIVDIETTI
jgi:hypothetical protein